MEKIKYLEEQLRESACLGDIETVYELISKGIDVNASHQMNGWTALHWAAKRGHKDIVNYLLKNGANKNLLTLKEETPLALATKPEIRILLGGEPGITINTATDLPITPNYIKNETIENKVVDNYSNKTNIQLNSNKSNHNNITNENNISNQNVSNHNSLNRSDHNNSLNRSESSMSISPTVSLNRSIISNQNISNNSSNQETLNQNVISNQYNGTNQNYRQPVPDDDELVLKVRIFNNSNYNFNNYESDFIEIELNKNNELNYTSLINICYKELNIDSSYILIEKIRKLPNTIIRNDKDIQRLNMYEEIEVILYNNNSHNQISNTLSNNQNIKGINNYPSIHKYKHQTILY